MDYQGFVKKLMKAITEKTEYKTEFHEADEKMNMDTVYVYVKENESSTSIMRLYAEEYYSAWKDGVKMDALVREVMQDVEVFKNINLTKKMQDFKDYEKIKSRLILRLISCERNKEELQGAFYRQVDDIALVLYMKTFAADEMTMTVKVPAMYANGWEISEEDIFQVALQNTVRLMPPRAYDFRKMIFNPAYEGEDVYDPDYIPDRSEMGNCLSTKTKAYGAVAIFYPDVADLFCQLMNTEELYLAFTSIHEVMVHDARRMGDPKNQQEVLKNTIAEATSEGDFLTEHIYHYDMKKEKIEMLQ